MAATCWIILFLAAFLVLAYQRASLIVSTIGIGVLSLFFTFLSGASALSLTIFWLIFLVIFVPLNVLPLRRKLVSKKSLEIYRKLMPKMSDTEKEALTAGSVGWTGDLFSGMPDWNKFSKIPIAELSSEEQAFLDNEVEKLCSMINNWEISRSMEIPDQIWKFLKESGFFGLIIPKSYGGKEFSNTAHSSIIIKVAGMSVAVGTVLSVPNSLGPAELLLRYGTEEQKNYYLPRLAKGQEIPCFALTSPVAGSDAGAITDHGVVCRQEFEGKERLCIRLNWDKRYITLSPVSTILGLAFKLYDPEHLLGDKKEIGITCALIPTETKGVEIGRRHYPLDSAFPNGPTKGKDVIIPLDWIIGGAKMAGHGWRMLMECLAAGRSISLPSMVTGGVKRSALASGSYARIRRQFNTYIGNFGGISEALARIAGNTYATVSLCRFTVSALDQKQKPAVASAISKYHTTEMSRVVSRDAMDIHGGKAICMGPNNYLAQGYIQLLISITVEGANILTRSMIIFGQGAIRCHPFVLPEMTAAQDPDEARSLQKFDSALFSHMGFLISNAVRSLTLGLTSARIVMLPKSKVRRYYQLITRYSAVLAITADICMLSIGANLKRLEKLSGRLGDMLSLLYIASAVLKIHETGNETSKKQELPVVEWVCQNLFYQLQSTHHSLLLNLPNKPIRWLLRAITLPLGRHFRPPSDKLGSKIAKLLLEPSALRSRFADNIYYTANSNNPVGIMEEVLKQAIMIEPLEKKLHQAQRAGDIKGKTFAELVASALAQGVLTQSESEQMLAVDKARMNIINVDDFGADFFQKTIKQQKVSEMSDRK